jgi:hypothetical protein
MKFTKALSSIPRRLKLLPPECSEQFGNSTSKMTQPPSQQPYGRTIYFL